MVEDVSHPRLVILEIQEKSKLRINPEFHQ